MSCHVIELLRNCLNVIIISIFKKNVFYIFKSGQFGNVNIQQAVDSRRSRYNDTTILLALEANILEISVRAWNKMLNAMKQQNVLHASAEIPSYRSMNRYQLMLPTIC